MKHIPVLQDEVIEAFTHLNSLQNPIILDATLGFGGHSLALLQAYPHCSIIGVDRDISALELAKERLSPYKERMFFIKSDFGSVCAKLTDSQKSRIGAVLADIGVSSMQLDSLLRGFSFESENLDMRMDTSTPLDAKKVLNTYNVVELERIFSQYGQLRESKKFARAIIQTRQNKPFESAQELNALAAQCLARQKGINPATQAFQAIRIEVNDELGQLQTFLDSLYAMYQQGFLYGSRVAIISFHSLEDKIVKDTFKQWTKTCMCPPNLMKCECGNNHNIGKSLYKKPLTPSLQEIAHNKRARSAKMRVFAYKGI